MILKAFAYIPAGLLGLGRALRRVGGRLRHFAGAPGDSTGDGGQVRRAGRHASSLAREFRVLADADSPKAEIAGTALTEARARRDAVRREWGRTHDELRERVRAYADAEILGLKKAVMDHRLPTIWKMLAVEYAGGNRRLDGEREITVRDNFQQVNAAVARQLEYCREADRLRERPLGELLDLVAESGKHFCQVRDFAENLMVERRVPASHYRELQGAVASANASFDPLTAQRGRFYSGPF
jgi:hypothetical protein